MSETEFRIGLDASQVTAGAKEIQKALTGIEKTAQSVGDRSSKSIDKIADASNRAVDAVKRAQGSLLAIGRVGGGGGSRGARTAGGGGGGGFLMLPGPGFGGAGGARSPRTMLNGIPTGPKIVEGTVVGGAARAAGSRAAGGLAGRVLGAAGGPLGMVAGSLIGGGIASMFRGGDSGPDPGIAPGLEARGFSALQSDQIAKLQQKLDSKFGISGGLTEAMLGARQGDGAALANLLRQTGGEVKAGSSVNDVLAQLSQQVSDVREPAQSATSKAWSAIRDSSTARFISDTGDALAIGADRTAGWIGERAASLLGRNDRPEVTPRTDAPRLTNDVPINSRSRSGGDMRIVVSAAKNVPTTMKNMGGR